MDSFDIIFSAYNKTTLFDRCLWWSNFSSFWYFYDPQTKLEKDAIIQAC